MDDIFIDMRNQNEYIQKYFPSKDFVSIDSLLNCIEDLDYQINELKEKIDELEDPSDPNGVWEMFDHQYKENRLREMEGIE